METKDINVKPLDDEFEKGERGTHRHFKKVLETDTHYIFEVQIREREGWSSPFYEVFRKVSVPIKEYVNGVLRPVNGKLRHRYPKDEDFGDKYPYYAFCCNTLERAKWRMGAGEPVSHITCT